MANYYSDHPEIGFYLNHPLMARIVELKEKGFADAKEYDYAPVDLGDAIENYKQILDITGDVAANIIEPNSESVDLEGPHLENGRMIYASKTYENLDATRKAGLWGVSMPRRYGGLNLPNAVFSMLSEMISAADAGFQNTPDGPSSRRHWYPVTGPICSWITSNATIRPFLKQAVPRDRKPGAVMERIPPVTGAAEIPAA